MLDSLNTPSTGRDIVKRPEAFKLGKKAWGNIIHCCVLQDPRQYCTTFKVKNSDFDKLPGILTDVMDYLKSAPGVDKVLPMSAKLQSLGDASVTIGVTVSAAAIITGN